MKQYTVGASVFCDFHFGGKPPGRVVEVVEEGQGNGRGKHIGEIRVRITKNSGAYKKGEVVRVSARDCVPVPQEFKKRGSFYCWVNTDYQFVKP